MSSLIEKYKAVVTNNLTDADISALMVEIKSLSQKAMDDVYMICRMYSHPDNTIYGSKFQQGKVTLNFMNFPQELQKILYNYVKDVVKNNRPAPVAQVVFD